MGGIALYCRVDRIGNAEDALHAINLQKEALNAHADRNNLQIAGYYEDCGFPGTHMDRPGLEKMIADCKAGLFDTVLVYNIARLYRGSCHPEWPFHILSVKEPELNLTESKAIMAMLEATCKEDETCGKE